MIEKLAKQIHIWYLEATKKDMKPGEFNPNAQKSYKAMTEAQRDIDRYIARKMLETHISKASVEELDVRDSLPRPHKEYEMGFNEAKSILLQALTEKSDGEKLAEKISKKFGNSIKRLSQT